MLNQNTDVTINSELEKLEQFLSTSGVKQGDNLAPVLSLSSTQYPTLSTRNGISQPLTLDGFRTLKLEASREDNYAEPITQQGTMFSFFKSYYVGDTAFILLSGEVIASKLIVSHFRRFGLTIHTGSKRKGEDSKTEAIHFPPDRNHRLLIWRTSKSTPTALCPFASSSNT
jgi:hypothetical protein